MPRSHRSSLECLYRPPAIIEIPAFRPVHVERLWCAPTVSYFPLHEIRNDRFSWDVVSAAPARLQPVVRDLQLRLDAAGVRWAAGPRVSLARKNFRHRRLSNSGQIEAAARALEFEVVYPEELPFSEQAALLQGARYVVAPEGSAIFLAMFARPGATLLILSHPLTDVLADYNGLFGSNGIRVLALTGPITHSNQTTPHDSSYSIDVNRFRTLAESVVRDG